jgi:hypothetical protein
MSATVWLQSELQCRQILVKLTKYYKNQLGRIWTHTRTHIHIYIYTYIRHLTKRWYLCTKQHGVTFQNTAILKKSPPPRKLLPNFTVGFGRTTFRISSGTRDRFYVIFLSFPPGQYWDSTGALFDMPTRFHSSLRLFRVTSGSSALAATPVGLESGSTRFMLMRYC